MSNVATMLLLLFSTPSLSCPAYLNCAFLRIFKWGEFYFYFLRISRLTTVLRHAGSWLFGGTGGRRPHEREEDWVCFSTKKMRVDWGMV